MELYLATQDGVVVINGEGDKWQVVRQGLNGRFVTSLIAREGVILAGTTDGIFCSEDNGRSWQEKSIGLTHRHIRWMAYHPNISDFELAGTEPAAIFISRDGGATWRECPEVSQLRQQFRWWLPYSPQAGCVRGFAHHGNRAYAAVEVGGLLCSDDGGQTWRLAAGSNGDPKFGRPAPTFIHPDVHSVLVHPSSPDHIFAPTGGGFYRSTDGGQTWSCLHPAYVRTVWVDPTNIDHLVLAPSDGPDGKNGRIETSHNGGQTWQPTTAHWQRNMVERFIPIQTLLFAVMANGELWLATIHTTWQPFPLPAGHIHCITSMG